MDSSWTKVKTMGSEVDEDKGMEIEYREYIQDIVFKFLFIYIQYLSLNSSSSSDKSHLDKNISVF